jgi:hypothetical protein
MRRSLKARAIGKAPPGELSSDQNFSLWLFKIYELPTNPFYYFQSPGANSAGV